MTQLLRVLVDIALLRRDPGVLPASVTLLVLAATADALASAWYASIAFGSGNLAARIGLHLGFALSAFWVLLTAWGRGHRYRQTMTALLGTSVLLTPIAVALYFLQVLATQSEAITFLLGMAKLAVLVWFVVIVAHIVRSALDATLFTGVFVALAWVLADQVLARTVFPAPA